MSNIALSFSLHNTILSRSNDENYEQKKNGTGIVCIYIYIYRRFGRRRDLPTGSREDLEQTAAVARCPASLFVLGPREVGGLILI